MPLDRTTVETSSPRAAIATPPSNSGWPIETAEPIAATAKCIEPVATRGITPVPTRTTETLMVAEPSATRGQTPLRAARPAGERFAEPITPGAVIPALATSRAAAVAVEHELSARKQD